MSKVFLIKTLFYTETRSDVLVIEGIKTNNQKQNIPLIITGNLGEIGKETAMLCLSLLNSIHPKTRNETYHINFEYPALKKEGSCWGLACFLLLNFMSETLPYLTGITAIGEINLRGEILPVRKICEKTAAWAKNESDYLLLPKQGFKGLNVFEIEHIQNAINLINTWNTSDVCNSSQQ